MNEKEIREAFEEAIELIENLLEERCFICRIHNPQHRDCTSCEDIESYRKTLSEIKEQEKCTTKR